MKHILIALAIILTFSANAQQINQGPAGPTLKDAAVVFTVGWFISFGAVVTGNVPQLCDALHGTYTPTGIDRCPDGQWRYLLQATPKEPTK